MLDELKELKKDTKKLQDGLETLSEFMGTENEEMRGEVRDRLTALSHRVSDVKKACIAGKDVSAILDERTPHCPRSREPDGPHIPCHLSPFIRHLTRHLTC
jgi:hypothetical protein